MRLQTQWIKTFFHEDTSYTKKNIKPRTCIAILQYFAGGLQHGMRVHLTEKALQMIMTIRNSGAKAIHGSLCCAIATWSTLLKKSMIKLRCCFTLSGCSRRYQDALFERGVSNLETPVYRSKIFHHYTFFSPTHRDAQGMFGMRWSCSNVLGLTSLGHWDMKTLFSLERNRMDGVYFEPLKSVSLKLTACVSVLKVRPCKPLPNLEFYSDGFHTRFLMNFHFTRHVFLCYREPFHVHRVSAVESMPRASPANSHRDKDECVNRCYNFFFTMVRHTSPRMDYIYVNCNPMEKRGCHVSYYKSGVLEVKACGFILSKMTSQPLVMFIILQRHIFFNNHHFETHVSPFYKFFFLVEIWWNLFMCTVLGL